MLKRRLRSRLKPWLREAWPALAAVGLFGLIAALLEYRQLDLGVYWKAAQRVFIDGTEPYTRADGQGLPFTYPPTALFMLRPLAGLTQDQAAALLLTLNLAASVVVMLVLPQGLAWTGGVRDLAARRLARFGPLYIACFGGVYLTLHFHQVNLLLLLCLWAYWRALRRGWEPSSWGSSCRGSGWRRRLGQLAAGASLALGSIAKPHYGLLVASSLGCPWRGRAPGVGLWLLAGAAAGGAALLALSLAIAPAGSWSVWIEHIPGATSYTALPPGHSSIAAPWNRSIAGEVARWLVPNKFIEPVAAAPAAAAVITGALVAVLGLITAWAMLASLRRRARGCRAGNGAPDPRAVDLELALLSVWVFLAAPASWTHHLVMLLPAALVLLRDSVLEPRTGTMQRIAAGLVLAVLALTLDDLLPRDVRTGSRAMLALMTVAVLGLWLLLLQQLVKRTKPAHRSRRHPPLPK
jgi:hypothetical protein